QEIGREAIDPAACTATFRVPRWPATDDVPYRLVYETQTTDGRTLRNERPGTLRRDPVDRPVTVAGMTCQMHYGFPYAPLAKNLASLDPDLLYFSGDQIYEQNGHYGIIREPADRAILNYLRKWYMFGWAFGDVMRDRPTVVLPDDHDVFHGNLWGEGGLEIPLKGGTSTNAGYIQPVPFINVVHRTQTAHHPDLFDPTPALRGISVFYGDMVYGRLSFALVSDRQFKSGPQNVDTGDGRADHLSDPSIDPATLDKPGLAMLGDRQEAFLEQWVTDWRGADMKVLLSGTTFANAATHHGAPDGRLLADIDSGGWPQTARRRALRIARSALAFHISGDQHLATLIQHGIDRPRDAIWGFCTPAIAVGYQRWWRPDEVDMPHQNRPEHNLPHTGEYIDGLGNQIFVYSVANPEGTRHDHRYEQAQIKASGFGLCRFDKAARTIDVHCYKFLTDVTKADQPHEYPGWPITLTQREQEGRTVAGHLPELSVDGVENAVLLLRNEATGELVYCFRLRGNTVRPWVFDAGATYTVRLGDPDTNTWQEFTGLKVQP
ncbi:MAG: alkaline phosphatase D family protein, partial [Patescibacteria group bacterium]|nr:alkaline phosphatase D family protein [Patescibacteria group bacterium]